MFVKQRRSKKNWKTITIVLETTKDWITNAMPKSKIIIIIEWKKQKIKWIIFVCLLMVYHNNRILIKNKLIGKIDSKFTNIFLIVLRL